jgi:mutator protein MutT
MPRIEVAIAVIFREGKILICQRRADDAFGGLWEFPGGKCEAGESAETCLRREIREELAGEITALESLGQIEHDYEKFSVRLRPFLCALAGGEPRPIGCAQAIWIDPAQLSDYQFPPANAPLLRQLAERFG